MAEDRRAAVVRELADRIEAVQRPHPVRVAIDGVDAAGKTTFADELAAVLRRRGRDVRRGELSPEGYYYDSFDYPALRQTLDTHASQDSILLVDGVFLLHPELVEHWDLHLRVGRARRGAEASARAGRGAVRLARGGGAPLPATSPGSGPTSTKRALSKRRTWSS
jgi:uridine kinase